MVGCFSCSVRYVDFLYVNLSFKVLKIYLSIKPYCGIGLKIDFNVLVILFKIKLHKLY